jgi:hypothetical protein
MGKPAKPGALLIWLILLAATPILAQQPAGSGPGLYNPNTVETVSGLVVSGPAPTKEGLPEPAHLTLKTDQGNVAVILGPRHYVDRQELKIAALDRIEVTGSRVQIKGKPVIIAAEIRKGNQVLKLREPGGTPLWGGQGRSR